MKKSFEEWMNGTPDPEPEEPKKADNPEKFYDYDDELPTGVDFGDAPGTYIYQCRSCGDWNPMDWELEEDHPDSHYCGKNPHCCPLAPRQEWLKHKTIKTAKLPTMSKPKANPTPPPAPVPQNEFRCSGCGCWYHVSRACMGADGRLFCGSYGCVPHEQPTKPPQERDDRPFKKQRDDSYAYLMEYTQCPCCHVEYPRTSQRYSSENLGYCGNKACLMQIEAAHAEARQYYSRKNY